jgi:peroxiredoxin
MVLKNQDGLYVRISMEMTGKKLLIVYCPDPARPDGRAVLDGYAGEIATLEAAAHVFVITDSEPPDNRAFLKQHPLPFMFLSDSLRHVARGLDVRLDFASGIGEEACTVVLADENRRVLRIDRDVREPGHAGEIVSYLAAQLQRPPRRLDGFAPVLYVPKVLELELCRTLIAAYEQGSPEPGHTYRYDVTGGDFVLEPKIKVRRDFPLTEPGLLKLLHLCLQRRVLPEISKALTRQVTWMEEFKVVCYDGAECGHFSAHRDNMAKHLAHRRFAMTINLNEGYEGGELRFPEYGPDLYAPAPGDAVIFSCSLLHEALPVTSGQRFALLSFLFDEESRRLNDRFRRVGE